MNNTKRGNARLTNEITTRSKPRQMACASSSNILFLPTSTLKRNRCPLARPRAVPRSWLPKAYSELLLFARCPTEGIQRCALRKPTKFTDKSENCSVSLLSTLVYGPFVTHGVSGNDACDCVTTVLFVFEHRR